MDSDRVNRWLAVVANLGVLIGLGFVALEIRSNNQAVVAQTADSVTDGFNAFNYIIASNPEVARIAFHGFTNPEKLTDLETFQFAYLYRGLSNQYRRMHTLYQAGNILEEEWARYATEIYYVDTLPGVKAYHRNNPRSGQMYADVIRYKSDKLISDNTIGRGKLVIE